MNAQIKEAVEQSVSKGRISCAAAHKIAENLAVPPIKVGEVIDRMGIRVTECRLGLFGRRAQNAMVTPAEKISPKLENAIEKALKNNRLSCAAGWKIADELDIAGTSVGSACEALNVKISACRLGVF